MKPRLISLTEYRPSTFTETEISRDEGVLTWQTYPEFLDVEFPSPKTKQRWALVSRGYVGHLPVTSDFGIRIQPKVTLKNVFGMLNYAYRLRGFRVLNGLTECDSLEGFFERLVTVVMYRIADRFKQGLYREYVSQSDRLAVVRGRIDIARQACAVESVGVHCEFDEHTADVSCNQIVLWTLWRALRTGLCSPPVEQRVRQVLRTMHSPVSLVPQTARDCIEQSYHRLNEDYRSLHAVCRLVLDNLGPTNELGEQSMVPFVINMNHLFEMFVAEWLHAHLDARFTCQQQDRVCMDDSGEFVVRIDLVLCDSITLQPLCVLDTKYKTPEKPSHADINQAVTYATLKGCRHAVLVYPQELERSLNVAIGSIQVRSLSFRLNCDLEEDGRDFLQTLLEFAECR